jgi:hypothetical protein
MNFSEALPDIAASYSDRYVSSDLYQSGYDYNQYYTDDAVKACGDNILTNVNRKKLDNRNNCAADTKYPGALDVKKIQDPTNNSKGMDETFVANSNVSNKKVTWGPSVVYDYDSQVIPGVEYFHRGPKYIMKPKKKDSLFDDNVFLLLIFAFIMYVLYTVISLKMEVDHLQRIIQMLQYQAHGHVLPSAPPMML